MSDEHNGQSENGAKSDSEAPPLYSRARAAPVIEGEAAEVSASSTPAGDDAPPSETRRVEQPFADDDWTPPRKSFARRVMEAAFVVAIGIAVYNTWTGWSSRQPESSEPGASVALAPPAVVNDHKALETRTAEVSKAVEPKAAEAQPEPIAAPAVDSPKAVEIEAPKTLETRTIEPKPAEPKAEESRTVEASSEPAKAPVVEPAAEAAEAAPRLEANQAAADPVTTKPQAVEAKLDEAKSEEAKPVEAPAESVRTAVAGSETEKALAETTNRLAATQSVLDQVTARLQAVEGQLAAPKTDERALTAEREASVSRAGNASARIVAAQSLLAAIRQGDDYAPMLAALETLGGDPERVALLRAGLATPNAQGLAKDFAALAAKTLAAAAPPATATPQAKAPENFAGTVLAFLETRAEKLVRIRPDGVPGDNDAAIRVERIEKDLARGDIAAALAERAQLPAPALVVTAGWAAKAQSHIDAELAAKAELAAALQELSKSRS